MSTKETPDSTAEVGLKFLSQLKQACDKRYASMTPFENHYMPLRQIMLVNAPTLLEEQALTVS